MASGGNPAPDDSEDDGDPPVQERQPEREGTTLTLFFPLPATFLCCEEGCATAYNPEVWTSRRQSLQRHLEGEHGVRITRTVYHLPDLLELLHVKKGLYNHEQRHRREEALLARQNATAGPPPAAAVAGPSGESCRAGDTRTPPHQPPPGPATPPHPPLLSAVSPTQAEGELTADQCPPAPSTVTGPPSQEVTPAPMDGDGALGELALGATPVVSTSQLLRDSADDDGTESAPVHQADNAGDDQPGDDSNQAVSAGDDVSSSEEYASPAVDDTEEPADQQMGRVVELSAPTEQATTLANNFGEAGREPAEPTAPHGDVTGSNYGTQDEAADTLGPESAWFLAEVTAELRDLGRSPVSEEQWARFEPILDRAEAAIVDHLRLPCRGSRQTPPRREINPDNASLIQGLYRRNRRRAVRLIAEGPSELCPINPGTLQGHFTELWAPVAVDTTLLRSRAPTTEEMDTCPFLPDEVAAKLRRCESTAPGEDRLTYHHWRQVDPDGRFLAAVFNICLLHRRTPQSWKSSRTILIYKKGDREDPTNWRPIALGRTIAKLYAGCLTTRLQRWLGDHAVLSRCQKGFLPYDGVFEHNFVLQGRLDDARTKGGELPSLRLSAAPAQGETFAEIVEELYRANTTCVVAAAGTTEPIPIRAGLRQGCPLSGLLFNLVVDPVIRAVQGGDKQHNILAYADDLTLLAADPTTLQRRLNVVTALSDRLGLRLKPAKCRTLHLSGRYPVGTRPTTFTVGGVPVPALADYEGHRFLGRPVGFRVLPDQTTVDEAIHLGRKLLSSMLTPWQRLDAVKTFLYPALNFAMRVGLASKGEWQRLDDELRPLIKKTLYVPARASNDYVYGSARAGTAGIPLAAELSDICRVDGAFKLLTSTDSEVRERAREALHQVVSRRLRREADDEDIEAYLSGDTEGDFRQTPTQLQSVWTEARKASRRLTVAWELQDQGARITCGEATVSARNRNKLVRTLRAILSQNRDRSLEAKPNQGKAMACVAADPANSHFMRTGRYTRFKEWRFIHRARLNLLPLNGTRTWVPAADKRCRRCGYREETLPHVLCHCMRQSRAMTERHNAIVARIKKAALGRFTVIGENQQVGLPGLRPDLVLARGEEALILDVCCPFDNRLQAFQEARRLKEEKYAPLQRHLLRRFQRVSIEAIVVGCLGSWDPANDRVTRRLCSKNYLRTMKRLCVSDTIAASTDIYRRHIGVQ
nr:uncharacterized protein LOC119183546 [Rhipicephalus microplus]